MIIWWGRGERSKYLTPSLWDIFKDKKLIINVFRCLVPIFFFFFKR